MTVLAALLANTKTIPTEAPREGVARLVFDQLRGVINSVGDQPFPDGTAGLPEVQVLPVYNGDGFTGGTLKLDFVDFQTEAFAFDATFADVQAVVDAAFLANVPGYTAGDIRTEGGPFTVQDMILVYEGDFYLATPPTNLATFENVDLEGESGILASSYIYQTGTRRRVGYGALIALGIVAVTVPTALGDDLTAGDVTVVPAGDGARFPHSLSADTVRTLVLETSIEEGNDTVATVLLAALGL